MRLIEDYRNRTIRLTDERLTHILGHPELANSHTSIDETLATPDRVVRSTSDPDVHLYYRWYMATKVGDKYLCVVVKQLEEDAFVVTSYVTDSIKRGDELWARRT